jgi:opacity protein-like surface antigen
MTKRLLLTAAACLALGTASAAAQSTQPQTDSSSSYNSDTDRKTSGQPSSATGGQGASRSGSGAATSSSGSAPSSASTQQPKSDSSANPAINTDKSESRTAAAPVPGANSFTEGEARRRIESNGYSNVTGLKKDEQGIWRGTATKNGQSGPVALDYQGNVVMQK